MLVELHVEHLGIIDEARVVLGPGLTAITGETGTGKTLLVDALELLLGGRADPQAVRAGASEARVEGRFVDEAGAETVVARVVPTDGRSRAYLDGQLATATQLAAVTARCVDLHGQGAHQRLLAPAEQRAALDAYTGAAARDALGAYREARAAARCHGEELAALGGDKHMRARELDLLRYQLGEIEAAAVGDAEEDDRLGREEALLGDAAAHREALVSAQIAVADAAIEAVGRAVEALAGRPPLTDHADRLRALQGELADEARELRVRAEAVTDDPVRLVDVQARRQVLRELRRKYGDTLAEVLAFAIEARARADEVTHYETRAAALEKARGEERERARHEAARLSAVRAHAAPELAAAATERLGRLAMPRAHVEVTVEPAEPGDDGADSITFLLAANPGEPARPLARAASGGELARVMLALRLALPGDDGLAATLVFDEIDAGIGGEAGAAVGRELAELGGSHQVVCVTHLAQVAAAADAQLVVTKRAHRGRSVAGVELLADDTSRARELSRMLAGVEESAHARRHAEELLAARPARRRA